MDFNRGNNKKQEVIEMWLYRRILKVKWTDKISNVKILQWMNKEKEIVHTIKTSKLQSLGHIMRNPQRCQLLQVVRCSPGESHGKERSRSEKDILAEESSNLVLQHNQPALQGCSEQNKDSQDDCRHPARINT